MMKQKLAQPKKQKGKNNKRIFVAEPDSLPTPTPNNSFPDTTAENHQINPRAPNIFTSKNLLHGSSEVQSSTIIIQPIPNINLSTIANLEKNTTAQNESTQIPPSRAPNSITNESINNPPTSKSESQSIANSSSPEMCNTIDNSEVANLQLLAEVVVSPPPPSFLQNGGVLNAILANNCALSSPTWKTSWNSINAFIKNRRIDLCGEDLPTYLPSGIEIKSDYGTSIIQWLNHLEDAGQFSITTKA
ncbi:hypothetical protein BY996DRAFT_6417450 [Phakopsora pachyrhizi]|nr:hypothetical protein BY996DRAFT_6417450 [Phakopsora pachyrhizi]